MSVQKCIKLIVLIPLFTGAVVFAGCSETEPEATKPATDAQIGFDTRDIEADHQRALDAGAEVVHPPRDEAWGRTSRYRDPDGNLVSITQPSG